MIHCVTTMNKNYYESIGKIMIHTWLESFPDNYKLHLYLEDFLLDIDDNRVVIEDWNTVNDLYLSWCKIYHQEIDQHHKFTKKALTQIACWRKYSGKIFWLDADTIFIKKIPENFFDNILEGYSLASWGDDSFESGTVFIDSTHSDFEKIKNTYESIYLGPMGLPEEQRWFDGELLGWACVRAGKKHLNLWKHCTAKTSTPLNRSWIGEYIQHFKASIKNNLKELLEKDFNRKDLADLL